MDDYENIFNGAGSAPTAAGGAASLGPDAAGYAPTAAATPTPRQTSSVDALAPLARQQATTALSLGASALSPENRQRWMPPHTEGDALSALVPPTTAGRNLTDGVFTRPVSPVANPAMPSASDSLARLRDRMLDAVYGRRVTREFLDALPEERKLKAMDRVVEALRKPTPGVEENLLDKWRNDDPNRFRGPYNPPQQTSYSPQTSLSMASLSMVNPPNGGKPYATYKYGGQTVLLGDDVDVNDSAAVQTRMAETNSLIDMMNEAYE